MTAQYTTKTHIHNNKILAKVGARNKSAARRERNKQPFNICCEKCNLCSCRLEFVLKIQGAQKRKKIQFVETNQMQKVRETKTEMLMRHKRKYTENKINANNQAMSK